MAFSAPIAMVMHRVRLVLDDVDGSQRKLLIAGDLTVAQLLAKMRATHALRRHQTLLFACHHDGHVTLPAVSALISDLPEQENRAIHCSLKLQNAFG